MNHRDKFKSIVAILLFSLAYAHLVSAQNPFGTITDPGNNIQITESKFGSVGGVSTTPGGELSLEMSSIPPSRLARRDYQNVYNEAQALLRRGMDFRTTEIQSLPEGKITVIENIELNYRDHNNGDLYYSFCTNYALATIQGYCPPTSEDGTARENIRNKLLRARDLYGVLVVADPNDTQITVDNNLRLAREVGREGILESSRELANIHLIFGNEFLVDALDYRFIGDVNVAGDIIMQEIDQLNDALQQFSMGMETLLYAFNADYGGASGTHIADFFDDQEFQLFSMLSERFITTLNEKAKRHRLLGEADIAEQLYTDAYRDQYIQILAIARKAEENGKDFYANNGWEMMTNLSFLYAHAQGVKNGFNPFGYPEDYVPIQTYETLRNYLQEPINPLVDARDDEEEAEKAERTFDQNADQLEDELEALQVKYNAQLDEICGNDNYDDCDEGLMLANLLDIQTALKLIEQTEKEIEGVLAEIEIEQERANEVIYVYFENGKELQALAYAIGVANSDKTIESTTNSSTTTRQVGVNASFNPVALITTVLGGPGGTGGGIGFTGSYNHTRAKTTSTITTRDLSALDIGTFNGLRDLQQATSQAQLTDIERKAQVKRLLLRLIDKEIEKDIRFLELNQLFHEQNQLVERFQNLLDLKAQAEDNLTNSHLNKPIYRILRDQWTVEAARSHALAAQFAYLTAKALEYEFLRPIEIVKMDDLYKARTVDEINNFMIALHNQRLSWENNPGERNRYLYTISLAEDVFGITETDPTLRFQEFQARVQDNLNDDKLQIRFTTSLMDNEIFDTGLIWNHRIAPKGVFPEQGCQSSDPCRGVGIQIFTRQFGNVGDPKVRLTHGGVATYQTSDRNFVEYKPDRIRLIGLELPSTDFGNQDTTVVIDAGINCSSSTNPNTCEDGTTNGGLSYLSVAVSSWILEIDLSSPSNKDLDPSQLDDIHIILDTTGIALQGQETAAKERSLQLRSAFEPQHYSINN